MADNQDPNTGSDLSQECKRLIHSLPKQDALINKFLYQFEGFWYTPQRLQALLSFQQHFQPQPTDLLLVSLPKSGTTWLKALAYAIVNRNHYQSSQHPLLTINPHDLVPFLEFEHYANSNQIPDLTHIPSPRLFATHIPYSALPRSVIESDCRIVYICRNPRDTVISLWHFLNKIVKDQKHFSLEEVLEQFCSGVIAFGPYYEYVLVHWEESLERPHKVLFLRYEDLKEDPVLQLKRLAKFLGYPILAEEERDGVVDEILRLCSFEHLSNLEVNKTGVTRIGYESNHFFRRGEVGDSANYLTAQMIERLDRMTEQKLRGSGLSFKES